VSWEPPTLKSVMQMADNPIVPCACGRQVNADMMRQLGDAFICDACLERKFRTGELTREDYALAVGAPDAVVTKAQTLDAQAAAP